MSSELISANDFKGRIVSRIREDIGNLIPQDIIDKTIEDARKEYLDEIKVDAKRILKEFYAQIFKEEILKLNASKVYKEEIQGFISLELEALLTKCGFNAENLILHEASLMTLRHLVQELKNRGLIDGNFYF